MERRKKEETTYYLRTIGVRDIYGELYGVTFRT